MSMAGVRCMAARRSSNPILIGGITSCSTNTSTVTTAQGLGASHQTGWTGLVAKFIQLYGSLDAKRALEGGKMSAFHKEGGKR